MVFEMVVDQICGCLEAGYDDHVCLIKSLSGVGRGPDRNFDKVWLL